MVSVSTHFLVLQFPDNSKEGFGSQCTWFPEPASCRPVSGFILVAGFQPKLSAFKKKKSKRRTLQYAWGKCYSYSLDTNPWDSCYHQRQDHSGDPVTWLPLGLWVLCIPQLACTCGDLGADWQPWGCRAWPCLWLVRGWARRQPTFPPCSWLLDMLVADQELVQVVRADEHTHPHVWSGFLPRPAGVWPAIQWWLLLFYLMSDKH